MQSSVDICVATFRRPGLLSKLLESLEKQTARSTIKLRIVVIDNDPGRGAEAIVADFQRRSGMDVSYEIEPRQGISYARNLAIQHVNAPIAAFLDDDEQAMPNWLVDMLSVLERYNADIAFGPVVGLLPPSAPAWAKSHPCFDRPRMPTGSLVSHGASGNVLFRTGIFHGSQNPFDERFARTGGEDTELFSRLSGSGCRLVWCDEAIVTEHVPPERLTLGWVCRRSFRGGQTYFRIFVAQRALPSRALWLFKRLVGVFASVPALPFLALLGQSAVVAHFTRMCGWLGQLSQCTGTRFEYVEYPGTSRDG